METIWAPNLEQLETLFFESEKHHKIWPLKTDRLTVSAFDVFIHVHDEPNITSDTNLHSAYKIDYQEVLFLELEAPKYPLVECYVCWNVSWPASADNLVKNGLSLSSKFYSSHCIRRQCFILLPNVWVVFKIYVAILHKIVAINNDQQSTKQAKGKKSQKISLLHYVRLAMLHIQVICF